MQLNDTQADSPLMFYSSLYDETVDLLFGAQEYFACHAQEHQEQADEIEKMVYSAEMSRITLRLSSVLAWLVAQKAFHNHEFTEPRDSDTFRLAFQDACLAHLPGMEAVLPEGVCHLLDKSLAMYQRVLRLDAMIARSGDDGDNLTLH